MKLLQIIHGYNEIFKKKAVAFDKIDDEARSIGQSMLDTMLHERLLGIGANMVGVLKRVVAVNYFEGNFENAGPGNSKNTPIIAFNPEIIKKSEEMMDMEEGSASFPGIFPNIKRHKSVTVSYLDMEGKKCEMTCEGLFASVWQHEIDYLDGITFFDRASKMKRDLMIKKLEKELRVNPPHVHGAGCRH